MTHIVARFEIPYTQYLKPDGTLNENIPQAYSNPNDLVALYKTMVLIRTFDKKAIALQRTGKMGTYAPINGQEAISTAIGFAMQKEDVLIPYYRDYAAQYQRGVKLSEILSFWGGDERGSQYANNKEDLPICVPIASQCLHAAGIAYAFKYRQQKRVAVVTLGEGGTSEGDFYEAINVAGCWGLPVVFVVNNNQWAISVPRSKQTATQTIAQKAIAAGFEGVQVDGNDVVAVLEAVEVALKKARDGHGPTLVEALTYRLCDHTTADDATRYQPEDEVKRHLTDEPIAKLNHYLTSLKLWDDEKESALLDACNKEVLSAVDEYLSTTPQEVSSIFDYHYETLPDYLITQRATAIEEALHA